MPIRSLPPCPCGQGRFYYAINSGKKSKNVAGVCFLLDCRAGEVRNGFSRCRLNQEVDSGSAVWFQSRMTGMETIKIWMCDLSNDALKLRPSWQ